MLLCLVLRTWRCHYDNPTKKLCAREGTKQGGLETHTDTRVSGPETAKARVRSELWNTRISTNQSLYQGLVGLLSVQALQRFAVEIVAQLDARLDYAGVCMPLLLYEPL